MVSLYFPGCPQQKCRWERGAQCGCPLFDQGHIWEGKPSLVWQQEIVIGDWDWPRHTPNPEKKALRSPQISWFCCMWIYNAAEVPEFFSPSRTFWWILYCLACPWHVQREKSLDLSSTMSKIPSGLMDEAAVAMLILWCLLFTFMLGNWIRFSWN